MISIDNSFTNNTNHIHFQQQSSSTPFTLDLNRVTRSNYRSIKSWLRKFFTDPTDDQPIQIRGLFDAMQTTGHNNDCCIWFTGHYLKDKNKAYRTDILQLLNALQLMNNEKFKTAKLSIDNQYHRVFSIVY